MANVKISELPVATSPLDSTVEMPVVQGGITKRAGMTTIGFLQSGTSAVLQTAQNKSRKLANAEDFGAVGDGTTNDSASFTAAVAAKRNLIAAAGASYSIKNVALSNSQSIDGNGAVVSVASGGTNLLTLSDYDSRTRNWYVSSGANASQALFRVKASRGARIEGIMAVNAGAGAIDLSPVTVATDVIALPVLNNIQAESVTGVGVYVGRNVSEMRGANIHMHGNLVAGTGGLKPASGTIGWRQDQPLSGTIARGGHQMTLMNMIAFETGWYFTDVELLKYDNVYADSCSGFGIAFDGTGNADGIELSNVFIGTTRGFYATGNANVSIDGLTTIYNGTIFSWMASNFYTGTAYDVTLAGTAKLTVSGYWRGDKKLNIASTAKLIVNCGEKKAGRTVTTIAPSTTNYLSDWGSSTSEDGTVWRFNYPGRVIGMTIYPTAAAGAGQSFTYTLRKNFASTTMVNVLTGASDFGGDYWSATSGISFTAGEPISIQLVTSASAATTYHYVILHVLPE